MKDSNEAWDEAWNIDKDIDRVLSGLRKAEAPEDLDRRILRSIDQRRAIAPRQKTTPHLASWRWATAAACVAAAVLAILWGTHKPRFSARDGATNHAASSVNSSQAPNAAPALSSVQPQNRVPHLRDGFIVAKVGLQDTPRFESANITTDATSDTFAPSQPAPPFPSPSRSSFSCA